MIIGEGLYDFDRGRMIRVVEVVDIRRRHRPLRNALVDDPRRRYHPLIDHTACSTSEKRRIPADDVRIQIRVGDLVEEDRVVDGIKGFSQIDGGANRALRTMIILPLVKSLGDSCGERKKSRNA